MSSKPKFVITNNGTINATKRYGVYIEDAEQVTITNNAGATIKTTYTGTATNEQGAIYGNNIGNCGDGNCYNSSDSNGGEGLTLHNYGTISSRLRTIAGGLNSDEDKSRNIKIYNIFFAIREDYKEIYRKELASYLETHIEVMRKKLSLKK